MTGCLFWQKGFLFNRFQSLALRLGGDHTEEQESRGAMGGSMEHLDSEKWRRPPCLLVPWGSGGGSQPRVCACMLQRSSPLPRVPPRVTAHFCTHVLACTPVHVHMLPQPLLLPLGQGSAGALASSSDISKEPVY